jgi:signal transduction histidine kinase/DNA-binding response OmpR family regulator
MSSAESLQYERAPPRPLAEYGPVARILVVDDDERTLQTLATVLEDLRQPIVVAESGSAALKHLLTGDFAVVLLDVQMPGMDGYEVAALMRARKRTRNIPIIFLTAAYRDDSHMLQAYSAGAVDMVFKPVDPFVLKAKVSIFIELYQKQLEVLREGELRHALQEEFFRVRLEKATAEAALRKSSERQEAILRSLPIALHSRSPEPPFVPLFLSASVERLTGFAPHCFTEDPMFGISRIHPDDRDRVGRVVGQSLLTGGYSVEFRWRCADGAYRVFLDQGIFSPGDGNQPPEIVGTMLDITDQRSLQQQLVQAQKMEAVGQLTGGIAHDFNNLLTVIFGNIDLLLPGVAGDDRAHRKLLAMRHACDRARSLTGHLLAFSRRQHLKPEPFDVGAHIRYFSTLLQQVLGERVVLKLDLDDESVVCELDQAQFDTTLLNLAANARDAMPDGGALTLSLSRTDCARELVAHETDARLGPWAVLKVGDSGVGMSRDVLERAFEPFFTTKDTGKGSGLGLSQVYGFVRQSEGFVTVDSALGQGTKFTLYLPLSAKAAIVRTPSQHDADQISGSRSGTILVVEDDAAVLALTSEMLSEMGYRVLTAGDANGAIDILRKGQSVDLLFTDVVMPGGKTGVQLAVDAHRLRPDIKVLLTSGYVGEALSRHKTEDTDLPIIAKPFQRSELDARIRSVIGRG